MISQQKLQKFQMNISRDMIAGKMAISVTRRKGLYRFFSINLSPKSAMLRPQGQSHQSQYL
jgi:hypothetical protein